jgi:hypothetical protein
MARHRHRRGMTLVELVVVGVVILGLMTVLGLGVANTSTSVYGTYELEQEAISFGSEDARYVPEVVSSRIEVELFPEPVIDGISVHMQYRAVYVGDYTLRNGSEQAQPLWMRFDFPADVSLVHGVELTVQREGEPALSPPGARYDAQGIEWDWMLAPGEPLHVRVRYSTVGRDKLAFELPQGTHPTDLDAVVRLPPGTAVHIPQSSLAPTHQQPGELGWRLIDAVSPHSIEVELPAGGTAPGRLLLLTELSALSMLLFGAGFWYASEGVRPGRLDDFRLGGLLLLALDYVMFYAIFAGVSHAWGPVLGLLGAVATLPLLVLHVAGLTDRHFALQRALPLAVATHVLLLAFVYLESLRGWLGLGAAVAITAGLTWTWRSWSAGRELHVQETSLRSHQQERRQLYQNAVSSLQKQIVQQGVAMQGHSPPLGAPVERAMAELERTLQRARALCGLPAPDPSDEPHCRLLMGELTQLNSALSRSGEQLQEALREGARVAGLELEERRAAQQELEGAMQQLSLVGTEASELSRQAPSELRQEIGAELARLRALQEAAGALTPSAPALALRQLARSAVALDQRLRARTEQLATALRVAEGSAGARLHCPSCGSAHTASGRFCFACGTPRPIELSCCACATVNRFPAHLMQPDWHRQLHCSGCGASLAMSESLEHPPAA